MQKLLALVVLIASGFLACAQNDSKERFFVGTFTADRAESVYLCDLDQKSGKLSLLKVYKGIDNPSFLKVSDDKRFLYLVSRAEKNIEKTGGFVVAYKMNDNGSIEFLNKQPSNGAGPCHIDVSPDGKFVAIATYVGGTTSLYPVAGDGSLLPCTDLINNLDYETGTDKPVPHAHSIQFSHHDNGVFSADLGTDKLNIYELEDGHMVKKEQPFVKMAKGAGPRHFEFHPDGGYIFVINELNSTISVLMEKNGRWKEIQNISTLPEGFNDKNSCADIHISKDGRYLYGSNRGHNSIAVFEVDSQKKTLNFQGTVPVEGNWPRNFSLSPDGQYLLAANRRSGNITLFRIDRETGMPEFTGAELKLPEPVCIEFF